MFLSTVGGPAAAGLMEEALAKGQFRGVPVYQFLYAEDSLDGDAWDARTWHGVPQTDYEKYLQIALETAIQL